MTCLLCAGQGIFRIGYQQEPEGWMDVAICSCQVGQRFRTKYGPALVAAWAGTDMDHVGLVEELLDPEDFPPAMRQQPATVAGDVTDAGRSGKKARL